MTRPVSPSSAPGPRKRSRSILWFLLKWGLVGGIWASFLLLIVIAWCAYDLPDVSGLNEVKRRPSVTLLATDGSILASYGDLYGAKVTLQDMPPYLPEAVLATEDRRFYHHWGIDPLGLLRDRQGGDPQCCPVDLGRPLLGQLAVEVVRVDPFERVTRGLEAADHQLVAGVRAPVATDVAVGADQRAAIEVHARRCGHPGDLLAQWATNRIGERRLIELAREHGAKELLRRAAELMDWTERLTRGMLASLGVGDDGTPDPAVIRTGISELWRAYLEPQAVASGVPSHIVAFLSRRMLSNDPDGLVLMARHMLTAPDRTAELARRRGRPIRVDGAI